MVLPLLGGEGRGEGERSSKLNCSGLNLGRENQNTRQKSFDGQPVDPDRERIASPGIERKAETVNVAEVDLSGILARPTIVCP